MRRHRRSTLNQQPSTSYALSSHHEGVMDPPHRRHREHRASSPVDFIADDEPLFVGAAPETLEKPRMYAGGIRSNPQRGGGSAGSIIVFAFALSGILLVFLLFYFLSKICSPSNEDGLKDQQKEPMHGALRRPMNARKMGTEGINKRIKMMESSSTPDHFLAKSLKVQESPRHVLYPRRIYEIQAEEGFYSSLPSMRTSEMRDDVGSSKKTSSPTSTARNSFKQLVRKLTTSSAPSSTSIYAPDNFPRLSVSSTT